MSAMHEYEPEPTLDEFGARLAVIRWKKGWNQKEAALACRLPHTSWRQWELSGAHPRNFVEVATKISQATGYDDYWIMTGRTRPGDGNFQTKQFWNEVGQDTGEYLSISQTRQHEDATLLSFPITAAAA